MELTEVLEKRRSIRKFKEEKIPVNVLKELVRRAGLAPSVNNSQPWKFIAVTSDEILNRMALEVHLKIEEIFAADNDYEKTSSKEKVERYSTFFGNAPAVIVVLNRPYTAIVDGLLVNSDFDHDSVNELRSYPNLQTIGAAVENILLSAVDLGYGGCWLTGLLVAKKELMKILRIKEPYTIAACIALGKPNEESPSRILKPLDEIFELIN